ncbi:phosphotransferase [Dactylosporangium salmoneum]|uniref:Aminoglycoside phosphotransferase domain-containing protein n=1 Tax=Dactylosporangium salmoneum TaxID=53361 RepID=A0ABN3GZM6_9ACTN
MIGPDDLGAWLGAEVAGTVLVTGNLSEVHVLRLADGREVVVKARPAEERLAGCAHVQRHLWLAGFPCPEPVAGPTRFGGQALSAELAVPGGPDPAPPAAGPTAALLARLIAAAPDARTTPTLRPSPPWIRWYHDEGPLWPRPDDRDADLNAEPSWHDAGAAAVRAGLARFDAPPVVGHCDFEAHNVWWRGGEPLAVHDWDSAVAEPEAVIVGVAAAMWPAGHGGRSGATVPESADFLDGYQRSTGRPWTAAEVRAAWAAGLWIRLFNDKKWSRDGLVTLSTVEAGERAALAGL